MSQKITSKKTSYLCKHPMLKSKSQTIRKNEKNCIEQNFCVDKAPLRRFSEHAFTITVLGEVILKNKLVDKDDNSKIFATSKNLTLPKEDSLPLPH